MITEDYVSFETAKLLKEKGFKEWCSQCYGFDVRHNGEPIDVNEEYELRDTGRENEIEYVDGGRMYDYGCGNFNPGSPYAAPTLYVAMKWLREVHHCVICITPLTFYCGEIVSKWGYCIWADDNTEVDEESSPRLESYEEAAESAIKYCLEKLI